MNIQYKHVNEHTSCKIISQRVTLNLCAILSLIGTISFTRDINNHYSFKLECLFSFKYTNVVKVLTYYHRAFCVGKLLIVFD